MALFKNSGKSLVVLLFPLLVFAASATTPQSPGTSLDPNPVYDDNNAYCTGNVVDSDSTQLNVTVNWTASSNQIYNETRINVPNSSLVNSTLASSNFTEGQEVLCNMTVYDGGVGSSQSEWEFDNAIAETFDPEIISGPNFFNYSSGHAFNVSAVVRDMEGEDELRKCRLNVTDGSNQVWKTMDLDRTYGNQYQVQCTFSRIENTTDFQVLENLDVMMWANDSGSGVGNLTRVNPIPNSPPLIYDIHPKDDSETSSTQIELKASVLDNDGEQIDVKFYNTSGSTSNLLHVNTSMGQQTTTEYDWTGLQPLETYYWYVNASDGHQNVIEKLRFRNLRESKFRVRTEFLYRYSTVIMSPNRSRVVPFSVKNTAATPKNDITTTVTGSDARFVSTGSSSENYGLVAGEERTFQIEISPEELGHGYLNITTENNVYDVATTDKIEVFVIDRPTDTAEVPGLGLLQIIFLLMFSTLFYSGRL